MTNKISYYCIVAAQHGNIDAMEQILQHYRPYIATLSKRSFFDEYGNRYEYVDDIICQRIEAHLMYKIIFHFDLDRIPEGLTVDESNFRTQ